MAAPSHPSQPSQPLHPSQPLDAPMEIKEGMVFTVETYCPATDGRSAARIEEEVVVGRDGLEILTKFPARELM